MWSSPLYCIHDSPVNMIETRSLDYPIACALFKILKTSSSDLVNDCRLAFGLRQFSDVIDDNKTILITKYVSTNNTVCEQVFALDYRMYL